VRPSTSPTWSFNRRSWALAIVAGLGVGWLYPLQFVPTSIPGGWVGCGVLAVGFALAIWAIVTIRKADTRVETNKPTTTIVANGPYRAGDADMAERLDRAVVEPLRDPARIGERHRHLVDDLLALVRE
jgi:protein-S-isoprenylcysteine O-methyltransferase Ste14